MNDKFSYVSEAINIHNALAISKKLGIGGKWKDSLLSSGFVTDFASIVSVFVKSHASLPEEIRQTMEKYLFDRMTFLAKNAARKISGGISPESRRVLEALIFFRLTAFVLYQLETRFSRKVIGIYKTKGIIQTNSNETMFRHLLKNLRFEIEGDYDEYISDITEKYTQRETETTSNQGTEEPPLTDERKQLRKRSEKLDHTSISDLIHKMQRSIKREIGIPLARKFIDTLNKEFEARKVEGEA
jgi:hypothetical protein